MFTDSGYWLGVQERKVVLAKRVHGKQEKRKRVYNDREIGLSGIFILVVLELRSIGLEKEVRAVNKMTKRDICILKRERESLGMQIR